MIERFMAKVMPVPESGCWLWTAACMPNGYGTFRLPNRNMLAHRVAFELFKGPLPDGLQVLHHCDVPCCVNPYHLFAGTQNDNVKDMIGKNRQFWDKDRCRSGHERNEKNTNKWGLCRECDRERHAQRYAKIKAARLCQ